MKITWHGQSCFTIKNKKGGEKEEISIIINPFDPKKTGLKLGKLKGDIILLGHNNIDIKNIKNTEAFIASTPGEFEIKNNFILCLDDTLPPEDNSTAKKNIIFSLEIGGVHIVHLGELNHILTGDLLSKIKNVDILMVPVGGNKVIGAKKAIEIINQIEPRIIIPMHYKIPGNKEKLDPVDKFIKEFGDKPKEIMDKFKIDKKNLPSEERKVIILNKK